VQAGKQYEYRVTAVGAGGLSDFSETSGSVKARPLKGAHVTSNTASTRQHSFPTDITLMMIYVIFIILNIFRNSTPLLA